jgi:hypothetical protein
MTRAEWLSLPLDERLEIVGAIWDSIVAEQAGLPDPPEVVDEVQNE